MPLMLCFRPFSRRAAKRCCCRFTAANAVLQRASRACCAEMRGVMACAVQQLLQLLLASRYTLASKIGRTRRTTSGFRTGSLNILEFTQNGGSDGRADARALSPGGVYWWNSWKSAGISYVATFSRSVNMTG